jgi:hypothetical protein
MVVPGPGEHTGVDNGLAALGHGEGVGRVVVTARGPTQTKPCADALLLRMVKAAVVKPKETRLLYHPNASTVHELLQGSGVFTATADRPLVTAAVSSRTMSVGALRAGETALHVVDTCIVPRLDITVPVHVMPVAKVEIYMYDKVQVGSSLTGEWHISHKMMGLAGVLYFVALPTVCSHWASLQLSCVPWTAKGSNSRQTSTLSLIFNPMWRTTLSTSSR